MTSGEASRWVRGGERVLASTRVLELRSVRYRHPHRGEERDYIVAHAPDWVNIVAATPGGGLVLVRQFRFGTGALSLEVPGGVMEQGEDPIAAAVRELSEETGYGGPARLLGSVHPNPAIMDNRCHIVLVEGAAPVGPVRWDDDEEIEVLVAPVADALAWARSGAITHSLTIAALMLYEGVRRV